ncbi:hypothetical protein ACIQVR_41050 [Streptomyces xanthochromogenes]|uniref:hypothetical protein n=1 Tax=Streptomyces xanthochromogenes TaxID=67384 RepID=UPI0037F5F66D
MSVRPPTVAQLLILADRAERGPLTAAEADRLRSGISGLHLERRAEGSRYAARARLRAVASLVSSARRRGASAIPVTLLGQVLSGDPIPDPGHTPVAGRTRTTGREWAVMAPRKPLKASLAPERAEQARL